MSFVELAQNDESGVGCLLSKLYIQRHSVTTGRAFDARSIEWKKAGKGPGIGLGHFM